VHDLTPSVKMILKTDIKIWFLSIYVKIKNMIKDKKSLYKHDLYGHQLFVKMALRKK